MADALIPFQFDSVSIPTVYDGASVLFPAKALESFLGADLTTVIGRSNSYTQGDDYIVAKGRRLKEYKALLELTDLKSVTFAPSLTLLTERGFYKAVVRSDMPRAKPFLDFVTGEVLPSIRRHGCYPPPAESTATATAPKAGRTTDAVRLLQQTRLACRALGHRLDADSRAEILAAALAIVPGLPTPRLVRPPAVSASPALPVAARPPAPAEDAGEEPDDGIPTFGSQQVAGMIGLTADPKGARAVSAIATRLGYRGNHAGVDGFSRLDRIERGGTMRDHWKYSMRAIKAMRAERTKPPA